MSCAGHSSVRADGKFAEHVLNSAMLTKRDSISALPKDAAGRGEGEHLEGMCVRLYSLLLQVPHKAVAVYVREEGNKGHLLRQPYSSAKPHIR